MSYSRSLILIKYDLKVRELIQTCAALHSSAFDIALYHSSLALEYAEKAFFDDKMVSKLYFPDEHKYAVYTPLFGPLALPLVLALLKELQGVFKGWKSTRLKLKAKEEKNEIIVKENTEGETKVIAERESIKE